MGNSTSNSSSSSRGTLSNQIPSIRLVEASVSSTLTERSSSDIRRPSRQCIGITKKGVRCTTKILNSDSDYCHIHNQNTNHPQCVATTKKGDRCCRRSINGSDRCRQHQPAPHGNLIPAPPTRRGTELVRTTNGSRNGSSSNTRNSIITDKKNRDEKANNTELECVACKDNKKNVIFKPCNHMAMCGTCSSKVSICPLCRKKIDKKEAVYY